MPRRAKIAVLIAGLWVASPIDLIPEFLPIIGPLDDITVVALALRYAGRQVPQEVLSAWCSGGQSPDPWTGGCSTVGLDQRLWTVTSMA